MADPVAPGVDREHADAFPASPYALPRRGATGPASRTDFLAAVPMLAGLPEPLRRKLASRSTWITVPAGEWLFRQGDVGDSLYVVNTGRLEVVIEEPAAEVVRVLTSGAVVGELALLTREPRSASVRARRDSELLQLTSTDFAELLSHEPRFSLALLRELGHQLRVSRGLEPVEQPLPVTIAVVSLEPASGRALWMQLGDALAALGPVARLAYDPDRAESSYGPGLDRAERDAPRVLMLTRDPAATDPWTAFCLRQADRVLLVTGADTQPRPVPGLSGCDVVMPAPVRGAVAREWKRALEARAVHAVGRGSADGVQRLARRLAGRSVGVVLSSGGARGLAHIGVLEELVEAGIEVDRVGGSSMGAFVGAMFAMGLSPAGIRARCHEELVVRRPLGDYAVPVTSLVRGGRARAMLARTFGPEPAIEELQRDFYCMSCDLVTGEPVVHRSGPVAQAVGASMCLPGIFAPIQQAGKLLVDGGVLDSLPVGPMAATVEGPIVAVDVGRRFGRSARTPGRSARIAARWAAARTGVPGDGEPPQLPTIKETLARSLVLGSIETAKASRRRADVVVEPDTGTCEMLDFGRLDEMVEAGRRAARAVLARDETPAALTMR
jgi:predicted acylesterase/phospholipase RssA/CRP-like cAMP-binding protein